jgi:hypothetical protein
LTLSKNKNKIEKIDKRRPKMANDFDKEYFVMNTDGANNRPLLAWGKVDFSLFLESKPVDEKQYELPLKIVFDEPYPVKYEMADLHMLATCNAVSKEFKNLLENLNIYGIQFVAIEITSNTGETISQYYVAHFWNKLSAIDKNNYEGSPVNSFGTIRNLSKFSLDTDLLKTIDLKKRLVFGLSEKKSIILFHKSIYENIKTAGLIGIKFFRVDEWDENVMFR